MKSKVKMDIESVDSVDGRQRTFGFYGVDCRRQQYNIKIKLAIWWSEFVFQNFVFLNTVDITTLKILCQK